jgi:hypothetical protein
VRANAAGALFIEIYKLIKESDDSTDTRCDDNAETFFIYIVRRSGIFPSFARCNECELFRAIKASHLNALHLICGFNGNPCGEVNRK